MTNFRRALLLGLAFCFPAFLFMQAKLYRLAIEHFSIWYVVIQGAFLVIALVGFGALLDARDQRRHGSRPRQ